MPENLKSEADRQINELLELGFIELVTSPMASPIVCCLQGRNGKKEVRIAIDYTYVNRYTLPDVTPLADMNELIQTIGKSPFISFFNAKMLVCSSGCSSLIIMWMIWL